MTRCRWWLAALLLVAACSGGSSAPREHGITTTAPVSTQSAASDAQTECRNALALIDAYVTAKQAGRTDVADPSGARQRCLASADVPPSCVEAMNISVTIAKVAASGVEFISAFTSYGEFSTLCRLKVLRSI